MLYLWLLATSRTLTDQIWAGYWHCAGIRVLCGFAIEKYPYTQKVHQTLANLPHCQCILGTCCSI